MPCHSLTEIEGGVSEFEVAQLSVLEEPAGQMVPSVDPPGTWWWVDGWSGAQSKTGGFGVGVAGSSSGREGRGTHGQVGLLHQQQLSQVKGSLGHHHRSID